MILESLSYTIFFVADVAVLNSYEVLFFGLLFCKSPLCENNRAANSYSRWRLETLLKIPAQK